MAFTLTTPALLFPAISLLLLAYTNRFLSIAQLIRGLGARYEKHQEPRVYAQIRNLRRRVVLIRNMQALGTSSLLLCVLCMFALFEGWDLVGRGLFAGGLVLMVLSLGLSVWEVQISTKALETELTRIHEELDVRSADLPRE